MQVTPVQSNNKQHDLVSIWIEEAQREFNPDKQHGTYWDGVCAAFKFLQERAKCSSMTS